MSLTQSDADFLIALAKIFESNDPLIIGDTEIDFSRRLVSMDRREVFMLDVWRGSLNLSKYKIQLRGREVIPLVRVDVAGAPHTNPDDIVVTFEDFARFCNIQSFPNIEWKTK